MPRSIFHAGEWFLRSGIQHGNGGVARYYRTDLERNHAVSTEITGYAASALVYLHSVTEDERYLEAATRAARFLSCQAWHERSGMVPFELEPARYSYFFDCGIIVRGLLAVWRATDIEEFLQAAVRAGEAMTRHFPTEDGFHPILSLHDATPAPRDPLSWSRSPGCYQLKSAMAWVDLVEATGDRQFGEFYDLALQQALETYEHFLPGHPERNRVMDRLHAFSYFLEGLLPHSSDSRCATAIQHGLAMTATHLREIAPEFERSDVYAQLLRMRIYADFQGAAPLDVVAAEYEANRLREFQVCGGDQRIAGGFYFGRKQEKWLPYVNPVSTAFSLQALELWEHTRQGGTPPPRHLLI